LTLTIRNIVPIIKAQWFGKNDAAVIDNVSIDSRSLQNNKGTLFFALIGPNYNSHNFIEELISNGVNHFVVSTIPENVKNKANFLLVNNTLKALQDFAAYYRSLYSMPVIGITGSNGKTIVKEWLNFLLAPDFNIIKSPKSYNSQVGVPLSVIGINELHNFGIFEAGISTVNEMQNLENIIKPSIGVLTNIGSAHDEGFSDLSQKIKEKLKLFNNVNVLIYNKNKTIEVFLNPELKTFSWSSSDVNADVQIHHKTTNNKTVLNITYQGVCVILNIPFSDDASIENVIHCVMVMFYLKYNVDVIQSRISMLYPMEMRLKVKKGINNTTIIDDSYSSDFQSLKIALDFLESQKQYHRKTVILSDIFQSGLTQEELYAKVSQLIISNNVTRVIAIGDAISTFKRKFINCVSYLSLDEFIEDFDNLCFENETILVKGARVFGFEAIVSLLEEKTHETVLEINLNAISYNLNFFKSKLKPETKIMIMVKAFGYGNGGFEIAKLLEYHKVDYLGVAFADEGIALKNSGIKVPIMVLNPETTSFGAIINFKLEPEIYSIKGLNAFIKTVKQKGLKNFPIHIKIDTGMHRLGFDDSNINELISILKSSKSVEVKSVLSHMAASDDDAFKEFSLAQINKFNQISARISLELNIKPLRHILNTSGISNFPESQFEMVRLGIGLYGISNNPEEQKYLSNVSTLKSVISQIRTIQVGESVGYSRRFIANRVTKVATIPIGYADGIDRKWGNQVGYVMINQQKATIIGSVCMDMLMADVTDVSCVEGNQVIILGENPSANLMAEKTDTIPYEILTSISQRVKRVFYRE